MTLIKMFFDWLKKHPNARCVLFCLIALMLGAGLSYTFKPAKVVEHTKTVTEVQTKVEYKDRVVTQKVYVQAEKKRVHTTTTTVRNKDGSSTTTVNKDESTDENSSTHSTVDAQKQEVVTKVETKLVEHDKLVLRQPDWRVYAGVGYQFAKFAGAPETGIPGMNGIVVQVGADRRIAGPIWLGVSLNTQYTAFVNLSLTL